MEYPLHIIIRRKFFNFLNLLLSKAKKGEVNNKYVDKNEIKNILLIRPNYRIGNIIFITPLVNELYKHLPDAKIDVIVGSKLAGSILQPMPNVDKVIDIPRKLLLQPIKMYRYIKATRAKKYDIAINISGTSTSAQIVSTLINAKYKATFNDPKIWADFSHQQVRGELTHKHMGLQSLEFLRFFDIEVPKNNQVMDIKLTKKELETAQKDLENLLESKKISKDYKTIVIFRNARFDKKIEDFWWQELIEEVKKIDNKVAFIDILSPDVPTKLNNNVLSYSNKNLRILGAFFKSCDLFISADTGPMHLATASGAKVLALFNKTDPEIYGTIGDKSKTINVDELSTKDVAKITYKMIIGDDL